MAPHITRGEGDGSIHSVLYQQFLTSQIGITGYQILHLRRSKRGCFRLAFVIGDGVGLELYHEP